MDLCNINEIKALLARHGFRFSKSMGQNFLIQSWVPQDIAAASGAGEGTGVLEVGPGIGPLTRELAKRADKVASVELDRSLLPVLSESLAGRDNVKIIPGDVMKLDLAALAAEQFPGMAVKACANLPYNITTPVITKLLEAGCFQSITVMIQREVARRICAEPDSADRGAFSLFCQYHAQCELLFDVGPECFLPAPKVTSSVIRLIPRSQPPVDADPEALFRLVKAAFAQRRKTLRNALGSGLGEYGRLSKDELRQAISDCGLSETVRGERLSLDEFSNLANILQAR